METKKCRQCGVDKYLPEYAKGRRVCKACRYLQIKKWNAANPDRVEVYSIRGQEHQEKKRHRSPAAYRKYRREYYWKNRDRIKQYHNDYNRRQAVEKWKILNVDNQPGE